MKRVLLVIIVLSLLGYGEEVVGKSPNWNDNLTLVKSFRYDNNIYISSKGNCYLQYYYGNRGSVSKVDCEDFNVEVGNKATTSVTDSSTELLEYIRNYCVVNDEYESFPRVAGTPVIKELQGKQLSCKLPDNIDSILNERAEYARLKNKFEVK